MQSKGYRIAKRKERCYGNEPLPPPPYQLTDAILALSIEIAAKVKEISIRSTLSTQPHLHRANRIRSVYSSLAIEHNSLTLAQVTALLNGKRVLAPAQKV